MGRPFNPHAERSRSTEFDSRGAHILPLPPWGSWSPHLVVSEGIAGSSPAGGAFAHILAAIGELESPPRCQRGDRGFESRWWRLRESKTTRGAHGVLREALTLVTRVRTSPPLSRASDNLPVWPSDRASPFQGEDAGLIPAIGSRVRA